MTTHDPLEEVTLLLRNATTDRDEAAEIPAGRDAAIEALAGALRQRQRTLRRRQWLRVPVLAAAAVVLVGVGGFAMSRAHHEAPPAALAHDLGRLAEPSGPVTALVNGQSETVPEGAPIDEGTELRTSDASEAMLDFASGTHVTLGGGSRMRLVEQTKSKRFALDQGSVSAKVAKLAPDERFLVSTSDAEVEVRGTAFRVSVVPADASCGDGTPTRLDVTEGVVVIRHAGSETRVAAGQHWPACAPAVVPSSASTASAQATSSIAKSRPSAASPPLSPATGPGSRLAEQNDLFDEAMRRKHAGDVPGAVARLDRLLATYPSGPLAESAAAERRRLLASSDAGHR